MPIALSMNLILQSCTRLYLGSDNQEILGYLYIGTSIGENKKIPNLDIDDFVSYL